MHIELRPGEVIGGTLIPVAEYRRASDEDQKFSTQNQSVINHAYAAAHGMVIVRTYTDEGKSGLNVDRRDALRQLIAEVEKGNCEFKAILVYDVSRWGRFQDPDESGHYEFICKRAGIQVCYCAEQFNNDGSPLSAIIKGIKRAMAAEYSRELSAKVFLGQSRLAKLGYSLGASAPYGLRRLLVDQRGVPKGLLARGERKSIQSDRVVIVPGPPAEVEVVRWIFQNFATRKLSGKEIARALNRRGICNVVGNAWSWQCVRNVLTNERYIGNNVWNRTSGRLKAKRIKNQRDLWLRSDGASKAIVSRSLFDMVQEVIHEGHPGRSDEEMLQPLRRLLRQRGYLSGDLIRKSKGVPSNTSLDRRFGGLLRVYERIGFVSKYRNRKCHRHTAGRTRGLSNARLLEALRQLLLAHGFLSQKLIDATEDMPCVGTYQRRFGSLGQAYETIGYCGKRKHDRLIGSACKLSNDQLLDKLRKLLKDREYLTNQLIDDCKDIPCTRTYRYRFGSLKRAYELIGYRAGRNVPCGRRDKESLPDGDLLDALRRLWMKHGYLTAHTIDKSTLVPASSTYRRRFGSLPRAYELIGYKPNPIAGHCSATRERFAEMARSSAATRPNAKVRQS